MAAAVARGRPRRTCAHVPGVGGARPRAPHGRRAPLGHRLRRRRPHRGGRCGLDEVVGTWPDDAELADWLRQGAPRWSPRSPPRPPTCECWTFLPAPSPLAMWARRQAHETAIHRVDAELAAGARGQSVRAAPSPPTASTSCSPASCPGAPPRCVPRRRPRWRCAARDADAAWVLRIGPDGVHDHGRSGRRRRRRLHGVGDGGRSLPRPVEPRRSGRRWRRGRRAVLGLFLDSVQVRWS